MAVGVNKLPIRVIGEFSSQHKEISGILQKHWHILEQDADLREAVGSHPLITYRRSKNLHDRLTHSHYNNPTKLTWLTNSTKGCHRCGNCLACPYVQKSTIFSGRRDINEYIIQQFINCKTMGVIYVMECICGIRYIGKTKREFRRRILEHVGDIRNKRNTSIANHINSLHEGNCGVMKFIGVEHIKSTTRVGDLDNKLLKREAEWIYWTNSKVPGGLNEGFTFSPFL
ncbi:hypothetical protein XELAEV_18042078mg [Xenopus laevis]|uniref:GIY-YIG domain-containing protein n=1 Tax=Xenopus laevis TaxID=8355 RepID=A0A974C3G8_XENLA|nr:hypothetical protein XELAEV_18042078mg [Xenopus laevis]